jgi:hypothetical protein
MDEVSNPLTWIKALALPRITTTVIIAMSDWDAFRWTFSSGSRFTVLEWLRDNHPEFL